MFYIPHHHLMCHLAMLSEHPIPPHSDPFADRLVRACAELPKMCEYFHIPFQSGDNDILREMKRGYTHERYRAIIDNIRRYMPDASVSGDVIVGFPGGCEPLSGCGILRALRFYFIFSITPSSQAL